MTSAMVRGMEYKDGRAKSSRHGRNGAKEDDVVGGARPEMSAAAELDRKESY